MRLKDKVAIITGGSSGIGKATALRFAEEGANVIVVSMDEQNIIDDVLTQISQFGGMHKGYRADVSNKIQVEEIVKEINNEFGKIDILINNAGITRDSRLVNMTEQQWDEVISVNLKGIFLVGQAVSRYMIEQNKGCIINTSSVVGLYGNFGQSNYAAAKWGVIGITKTWARELGKYGIRVNAIAPGFTLTDMVKKMPENVLNSMKERSLLKCLAEPVDIANGFLYLSSDEARYVTGTVLSIDGGIVL